MGERPWLQKAVSWRPHFGFLEVYQHDLRRRAAFVATVGQQDADVLDGCDQVILDLLPPESSPARTFEVMVISRIGKARFHELLPASSIPARGAAVSLAPR